MIPKERYCVLCLRRLPNLRGWQRMFGGLFSPPPSCAPPEMVECFEWRRPQ